MSKFMIEAARYGEGEGGMACGPVDGVAVAEIQVKDEDGAEFFLSMAVMMDCPSFFKSDFPLYEHLLDWNSPVQINDYALSQFDDFSTVFEAKDEDEMYELYRYLIYMCYTSPEPTDEFIQNSIGKYVDEIDIPQSVWEEDYYEELEWEEEDDDVDGEDESEE